MFKYQSKLSSRYVPVDASQIGLKIAESDYYVASVKHDGHLAVLSVTKGKASMFNRNGEELKVPTILKAASAIKDNVILAGELCCFVDDQPTTHREVSSALAKPEKHDLRFGAFDVLELNGAPELSDPKAKVDLLNKLAPGKEVFAIEHKVYESRKDLASFYKEVAADAEGIVVRSANGIIYKVKESITLDLVVLGYAESTGDRAGWMRELVLGFALGNNRFQIVTKCGGGFTDKDRQEFPKMLEKLTVESEYTEVSGAKTAFIMVKPEIVVEISCLDLINEAGGTPIRKAILAYDEKKGYLNEGNYPTLSIISPNFIRIRTDKQSNEKDAGSAQAYELVPPIEASGAYEEIKPSSVMMREVFVKTGKGGTAIRKFVGLKTKKEDTGLYSPYLVVFTDYSAGRKTPLEQELFLCSSEKEVKERIDALKEENIKKGWELVK